MRPCAVRKCRDVRRELGLSELVLGQCRSAAGGSRDEPRRDEHSPPARAPHAAQARQRREGAVFLPIRRRLRHHLPQRRQLLSRTVRMLAADESRVPFSIGVASIERVRSRSTLSGRGMRGHQTFRTALPERAMHGAQAGRRCVAPAPRVALQSGAPPSPRADRPSRASPAFKRRAAGPTSCCLQNQLPRRPSG
jgi:hypothetical protein